MKGKCTETPDKGSGGCRATGGIRVSGISGTTSIGKAAVWDHAMARVSGHGWVLGDRYSTGDPYRYGHRG